MENGQKQWYLWVVISWQSQLVQHSHEYISCKQIPRLMLNLPYIRSITVTPSIIMNLYFCIVNLLIIWRPCWNSFVHSANRLITSSNYSKLYFENQYIKWTADSYFSVISTLLMIFISFWIQTLGKVGRIQQIYRDNDVKVDVAGMAFLVVKALLSSLAFTVFNVLRFFVDV